MRCHAQQQNYRQVYEQPHGKEICQTKWQLCWQAEEQIDHQVIWQFKRKGYRQAIIQAVSEEREQVNDQKKSQILDEAYCQALRHSSGEDICQEN